MQLLRSLVLPAGLAVLTIPAASAGPVVCRTSIEAPLDGSPLVEVSRCAPVTTTPELMEQRFFSYTAPYARGVSVVNQITDVLGIAMGGREGNRVMGLGFPDQTIVWDGSAVENTYQVLFDHQSSPLPWRTADVSNGLCHGLAQEKCSVNGFALAPDSQSYAPRVVKGLW